MYWHKRLRNVTAVVLAVVGFVATSAATSGALAAGTVPQHLTKAQAAIADGLRLKAEIKLLDPYVVTNERGTLTLSPPAALARHVDPRHMAMLRNGLATVNQKIQAGELMVTSGHRVVDPKAVAFNIQWNWNGRSWQWWGVQDYFNEYWTLKIEAAYNMGAALATICAVVAAALAQPEVSLVCGIAVGVLWFGAAWMAWADNGGGVVVSQTYTPFPIGGIWISGQ
jgi:hypothetical protein